MALLLISRGSFSGGLRISQCFAELGVWKCLTREELIAAVNTHGELANRIAASIPTALQDYGKFTALRRPYKILTQLALLEYAIQGDVAYFGYSGHLLLPNVPHAVRARILAPLGLRIKLFREREDATEEEARERIRRVDEERARWTRFMYGKSLQDPNEFDLCVNLGRVSFSTACAMLVYTAQQPEFRSTPESAAVLQNRYICARVLAAMVIHPKTSQLEVGATAEDGHIVLQGPYLDEADRSAALDIAGSVPGVAEVQYREGYAPAFDQAL